jgi:hypothetical protein
VVFGRQRERVPERRQRVGVELLAALPDELFTQSVLEFGDERLDLRKASR